MFHRCETRRSRALSHVPGYNKTTNVRHGEGNGIPLQSSCLGNPMDGGAWKATVHGVAKSQTRLSNFSLSCIGEGNGNPLQCSCLENLRDRGAWWAAISGVAQSRTQLMRLSSSSSQTSVHFRVGVLLLSTLYIRAGCSVWSQSRPCPQIPAGLR